MINLVFPDFKCLAFNNFKDQPYGQDSLGHYLCQNIDVDNFLKKVILNAPKRNKLTQMPYRKAFGRAIGKLTKKNEFYGSFINLWFYKKTALMNLCFYNGKYNRLGEKDTFFDEHMVNDIPRRHAGNDRNLGFQLDTPPVINLWIERLFGEMEFVFDDFFSSFEARSNAYIKSGKVAPSMHRHLPIQEAVARYAITEEFDTSFWYENHRYVKDVRNYKCVSNPNDLITNLFSFIVEEGSDTRELRSLEFTTMVHMDDLVLTD